MSAAESVRERFEAALAAFVEKARGDPYILAAILIGSLAYDEVWEKSDIDVLLVAQEGKQHEGTFSLVEEGAVIHAFLYPRGAFKRLIEGSVQGSFFHSAFNRGRILFTRDETIRELFDAGERVGSRDRDVGLLRAAGGVLPVLTKAQKWLRVKRDLDYTFIWVMACVSGLAKVETLLHGEVPGREAIHQAARRNPEFFEPLYGGLIRGEKGPEALERALGSIERYLRERAGILFRPLLEHLLEAGGPRSSHELAHYFNRQMNVEDVDTACEWLAEQGILGRTTLPVRLTPRSRVDLEEAAYYYEGEERA